MLSDDIGTPSPVRKLLLNLAREEWLAKFAALPFLIGLAFQLAERWASAPGDVLLMSASLLVASQTTVSLVVSRMARERLPAVVWPLAIISCYFALVFAYWVVVDAGLAHDPGRPARFLIYLPVVLPVGLYWKLRRREKQIAKPQRP